MAFVQNFPFISIVLSLFSGPLTTVLGKKAAKTVNTILLLILLGMNAAVFVFTLRTGESYTYMMGHYPAPWGNEIRAGVLESGMATFFCLIMLFCMMGGIQEREVKIEDAKQNLYYVMTNLLLCSLLALVYTNDIFTAYVFVEINTISACGLIMVRQTGRTLEAAMRYMIMSLLGSGLLLLGICYLYDITGHLLMSNIKESVAILVSQGTYAVPLNTAIALMCTGLAIKSALFPFHLWLPDAYGYSTVSSAAILSSLVSKGYIFLLIKIMYRVIGFSVLDGSTILLVLFVFGLLGMIVGSVNAIRENDIRRMIAYSSVAQIGYIFMGFGLSVEAGVVASIFHILSHAATKSLLFVSASGLTRASGYSKHFSDLTGSGYRSKMAGVAFTVGGLSMVGLPLFSGFISKVLFAQASLESGSRAKMLAALIVLAISTILNAIYFMKTILRIYTPMLNKAKEEEFVRIMREDDESTSKSNRILYIVALVLFISINLVLGLFSDPIVTAIREGLAMFD